MTDTRDVVLWRLHNGEWDQVGRPRPASAAAEMLAAALAANRRAYNGKPGGDLFAVLPVGEKP